MAYVQHLPHFNVNPLLAGKFTIEIGRRTRLDFRAFHQYHNILDYEACGAKAVALQTFFMKENNE